jgi:mRNA-degrading endonuclease toxin of MazEF toxin-antitoxin module
MAGSNFQLGDVLLAFLVFSDAQGIKRRPVMVVHDFGDDDLLVVPITSHPTRNARDVLLSDWKGAGLKLPSTVRSEKFATIAKTTIARPLGKVVAADAAAVRAALTAAVRQFLR